jgi:hypothetical protein
MAHALAHTVFHVITQAAFVLGAHRGEKGPHSFRRVGAGRLGWGGLCERGLVSERMGFDP